MQSDERNSDVNNRALKYWFEIQHFTPHEAFKFDPARVRLTEAGITPDMRGNQVALLADGDLADRLRDNPEIKQKLADAGWALQKHNSFKNPNTHPGYNNFFVDALDRILQSGALPDKSTGHLTEVGQIRAAQHLFDYGRMVSRGQIIDGDNVLSLMETDAATFFKFFEGFKSASGFSYSVHTALSETPSPFRALPIACSGSSPRLTAFRAAIARSQAPGAWAGPSNGNTPTRPSVSRWVLPLTRNWTT